MNSVTSAAAVPSSKLRPFFRSLLWGVLLTGLCGAAVKGILRYYEVPLWLRLPLALAPLLPFAYASYAYRRDTRGRSDELDQRISSDATAAAFYGFFFIVIIVDMLVDGGVLNGFVWTKDWLLRAMIGCLLAGWIWSVRRFR